MTLHPLEHDPRTPGGTAPPVNPAVAPKPDDSAGVTAVLARVRSVRAQLESPEEAA